MFPRFHILVLNPLALVLAGVSLVEFDTPLTLSQYSTLKAAKRHDHILPRSNELMLTHKVELAYAEELDYHPGSPSFSSRVQLDASRHTLLLENFDHLLEEVTCDGTIMTIVIKDTLVFGKARASLAGWTDGLLISSHETCSEEGAHAIYRIVDQEFNDRASTITFNLVESLIEVEYHTATVDFGHSTNRYTIHQHERLSRRQATPTTSDSVPTPSQSIVAQGNDTYNVTDLGFSWINTTFLEGTDLEYLNPIGLGCKNCSATGQLITTSANFELDIGAWLSSKDDDIVKTGFVEMDVNGFSMSIGLKAVPSVPLGDEFAILPPLMLLGFQIPKIGSFGVTLELDAYWEVEVGGGVELGFGFDIVMPDSKVRLDVAETQNSGIDGFNETTFTMKPLSANSSDLEFNLVGGLRPKLSAGLTLLGWEFTGGPYLTLPNVNMTASQLASSGVGANCEVDGDKVTEFEDAFQNLTHVDYNIGFAAGIEIKLAILHFTTDIVSKQIPITTQCMVWQTGTGTETAGLAFATAVLESMTATTVTSGGAGGAKTGGVSRSAGLGVDGIVGLVGAGVLTGVLAVVL